MQSGTNVKQNMRLGMEKVIKKLLVSPDGCTRELPSMASCRVQPL